MAITPIPVVTFQSSIEPVNPPPQANQTNPNAEATQNQVQDLQQLPVNQIPTQAPGLFGLAFALENLDQRNQNFLNTNLPKPSQNPTPNQQTANSAHSPNSQSPTRPPGLPPSTEQAQAQQTGLGQFAPPQQAQAAQTVANQNPQQQAGAVLNLFA